MTVEEILNQYDQSKEFYSKGGITVTGGEPLMQIGFVTELFEAAHKKGIHTCLDTSGVTFRRSNADICAKIDCLLAVTDLIMLDIKHIDPAEHEKLCAQPNENILDFARYLDEKGITMWIRHVVVPGITDDHRYLYHLGLFIGALKHVKALDVLPYHNMGEMKYEKLGIPYPLKGVSPATKDQAVEARKYILKGIHDKRLMQK